MDQEQYNLLHDNGASETTPIKAGNCKKGGLLVIKGNPCKIIDISTSKTGKHGHAKAIITAVDIFTGKKYQESAPTSHNLDQPNLTKTEYQLIHIEEDGFVSLMDEDGNIREDLSLDLKNDDIHVKIKNEFDQSKEIVVTVMKCLQKEKIISFKENNKI